MDSRFAESSPGPILWAHVAWAFLTRRFISFPSKWSNKERTAIVSIVGPSERQEPPQIMAHRWVELSVVARTKRQEQTTHRPDIPRAVPSEESSEEQRCILAVRPNVLPAVIARADLPGNGRSDG